MLIVLTSEREIENEAMLLSQLFENGLEVLHLRKPTFTIDGYRELLRNVDEQYYQRIVIHQFHDLCKEFKLKGIHIQEQPRIDLGDQLVEYFKLFKSEGFSVSSSFHEPEVLNACSIKFDYHLLSPVFSSISKEGYKGRGFDVNHIDKTIIGMGGVNSETIHKVYELGYSGVGVLGGIWNSENSIKSFKLISKECNKVRNFNLELLSGDGELAKLKEILSDKYTQLDIDNALINAVAYGKKEVADYLISLGADISYGDYEGVYYAVHNNELEGVKYAISKGVDINVNEGMILNAAIYTTIQEKCKEMLKWILEHKASVELLTQDSKDLLEKYGTKEQQELINSLYIEN